MSSLVDDLRIAAQEIDARAQWWRSAAKVKMFCGAADELARLEAENSALKKRVGRLVGALNHIVLWGPATRQAAIAQESLAAEEKEKP